MMGSFKWKNYPEILPDFLLDIAMRYHTKMKKIQIDI